MAKTIDEAIALFRSGKSPRECDKLTGINYKKIEREAKKRGVEKGDLSQLTQSLAMDTAKYVSLSVADQDIVTKEVAKQLEGIEFYNTHARMVSKIALKSLQADMTPANAKTAMATLKEGLVVEGLVPYYPNAPQINTQVNTQTVIRDDSKSWISEVINGLNAT